MKYWLIVWFLAPNGEYVGQRQTAYKDEATCYMMMESVRPPRRNYTTKLFCVSDDHFRGVKQDPNTPYD